SSFLLKILKDKLLAHSGHTNKSNNLFFMYFSPRSP
ncbi:unnamed protein product, partial [marine sediment metagenome]